MVATLGELLLSTFLAQPFWLTKYIPAFIL